MKCVFCGSKANTEGYIVQLDRGPHSYVKRTAHIACLVEAFGALEWKIAEAEAREKRLANIFKDKET